MSKTQQQPQTQSSPSQRANSTPTTRELATISAIEEIVPIENSENLLHCRIRGWWIVINKNEGFKVGDKCVYFEVDSVLPIRPWSAFMAERKYRIKTIKLRGALSQGLCCPLSILPENHDLDITNVTEVLEVEQYLEPQGEFAIFCGSLGMPSNGRKGNFPDCIPKTEEHRIQNMTKELHNHVGRLCYITEKMEGTSVTYAYLPPFKCAPSPSDTPSDRLSDIPSDIPSEVISEDSVPSSTFVVCSRNLRLNPVDGAETVYWKIANRYKISDLLKPYGHIAIQGEIIGDKIQGNYYGISGHDFFVFSLYYIDEQRYANFEELVNFCAATSLKMVPIINPAWKIPNSDIQLILKMADAKSTINGKVDQEGYVIRSLTNDDHDGGRLSFKVINNAYLLKKK